MHNVGSWVNCFEQKPRVDYVNTTCQTRIVTKGPSLFSRELVRCYLKGGKMKIILDDPLEYW